MSIKQELDTLLHKEMDRKTFIKHIAFAVAMLTGVTVLIRLLRSMNHDSLNLAQMANQTNTRQTGYGRVGYGTRLESDS